MDLQQVFNFPEKSKVFEVGLTVRFKDLHSLNNYDPHPSHQAITAYLKEIGVEDSLIVDFETR